MTEISRENLKHRLAIASFFFLQGVVFSSWASRIPDIKTRLDLNDAQLGSALLAIPIGQFCVMWPAGMLVGKLGSRNMAIIGALLYPFALILAGISNSMVTFVASLVLFGIAANIQNISINTQAVDIESVYGRSIMSTFHGMWSLAGAIGGVATSILAGVGVTSIEQFIGVFIISAIVLALGVGHLMPPSFEREKQGNRKMFARPDKLIIFIGFIGFACWCTEGTMFDWSGVYFDNVVRVSPDYIRAGFIAFMSAMTIGRFLADTFVNRFGALKVVFCGGLLVFFGMGSAIAFPNLIIATTGFMMTGLGVSSIIPICYSIAGRSKTLSPSLAIATVASIGFFGFLICPPLIGYISYATNLRVAFSFIAMSGLMLTFFAHKVEKLRQ